MNKRTPSTKRRGDRASLPIQKPCICLNLFASSIDLLTPYATRRKRYGKRQWSYLSPLVDLKNLEVAPFIKTKNEGVVT